MRTMNAQIGFHEAIGKNRAYSMMSTPSIFRLHYENVLRQDLLLKLNYTHILQVPRLCGVVIVPKAPSNFLENVKLAIENLCGQKCTRERSKASLTTRGEAGEARSASPGKSFSFEQSNQKSERETAYVTYLARSTLRGHNMYKFLEKLSLIIPSHFPVRIRRNSIQCHFSMATTFLLKEFPQIKDNFGIFAHIRGFEVTIVTSADTPAGETLLLWSGFEEQE